MRRCRCGLGWGAREEAYRDGELPSVTAGYWDKHHQSYRRRADQQSFHPSGELGKIGEALRAEVYPQQIVDRSPVPLEEEVVVAHRLDHEPRVADLVEVGHQRAHRDRGYRVPHRIGQRQARARRIGVVLSL